VVLVHCSVACAVLHTVPQPPQSFVFVMSVSQPSVTFALQSAWPESHAILHAAPTQLPAPPAWLQTWPQTLQLLVSLVALTSQPSARLPLQSRKPLLHAMLHFELAQLAVPLFALHTWSQPPQLFGSFVVLVAQPAAAVSQLAIPTTLQLDTAHAEFVQTSFAPGTAHDLAHTPQLFGSLAELISQPSATLPLQSLKPVLHAMLHFDAVQLGVPLFVLHGDAHDPQWSTSVFVSTHAALAPPPGGQSVGSVVLLHCWPQLTPSHVETPFDGTGHTLHDEVPHELVDVLTRQTAAAPVPQLCVPAGQTHWPPLHSVPPVHPLPQTPQFFGSTERS
jgi:hypothetical protein